MLTAARSVSIGESQKIGLVYRRQHRDDSLLNKLVFYGGYAQRAFPAIGFRDIRPQHRLCTVAAFVDCFMQLRQAFFELLFVVLPRDPIYPRRRFAVQLVKALAQQLRGDVVQQRGKAAHLVSFGPSSHAFES